MIDTASFLNSKDIADHWYKISWNSCCTPVQSAYVIWHNRSKTYEEKYIAWNEIINTMPDCPTATEERKSRMRIPDILADSLHAFLRAFMHLQNNFIARFYREGDHAVYHYRVHYTGDKDWKRENGLYDTAAECFIAVNADEELVPDIACIQITKQWIGADKTIILSVKADQTVMDVDAYGFSESETDLLHAFEYMWFDFPTPFLKGDIVVSRYSPFGYCLYGDEPFVLTNLCSWGSKELKLNGYPDTDGAYERADRQLHYHRKRADETDMTAYGYFQREDGSVYHECMHHYLDLEYYREEPKGIRRILKAFSSFEKEKLDIDLFVLTYHIIMEEEKNKRDRELLSCFTDDGLRLAGLR